jgi:DNA-binding NarL/FixJ family response regulator
MNTTAPRRDVVLIVDDTPANLAYLSDALHDAGFKVLVATGGPSAVERLKLVTPDIILLDAVMPGMDGFETCSLIKHLPGSRDIPVIFMTGLTDVQHVVRAFEHGAIDYVAKPVRQEEVRARIVTHIARSRMLQRAQRSVESCGKAGFTVDAGGHITWQTPLARAWLTEYLSNDTVSTGSGWNRFRIWLDGVASQDKPAQSDRATNISLRREAGRLKVHYAGTIEGGERLLLVEQVRDDLSALRLTDRLGLTPREAEVLNWLRAGKTNRDIAEILGISPRTVNKHLDRIYVKLGVETRLAAAAVAMQTMASPLVA